MPADFSIVNLRRQAGGATHRATNKMLHKVIALAALVEALATIVVHQGGRLYVLATILSPS
jgi:hypothetical protein